MIDIIREENERLKQELSLLRQAIINKEPMVFVDGRFEEMITSPKSIITIARQMVENMPETAVLIE